MSIKGWQTDLIIIVSCLLLGFFFVLQRGHLTLAALGREAYQRGDYIGLKKLAVQKGPILVIVTKSGCPYCTDSMTFYHTLPQEAVVWVAMGEDETRNRIYLTQHGIEPHIVISAAYAGLTKISATPTVIAISADGHVVKSWIGQLDSKGEREVLAVLHSLEF